MTIVSILRLRSLIPLANTTNQTWAFYEVALWSSIEMSVGVMCACLPAVRLVLIRIFPAISGSISRAKVSTHGHRTADGRSGSSRFSYDMGDVALTEAERSSPSVDRTPAIMLHQSYTVEYSEGDNIALVEVPATNR